MPERPAGSRRAATRPRKAPGTRAVVREGPPTPVVLDTSALIAWTLQPDRLTRRAGTAIADAMAEGRGLVASAISLWEIGLKVQQDRLTLGLPFEAYVARLDQVDGLTFAAVTAPIWLRVLSLDWAHRDPADRVIVATADLLGAPLVTSDRVIRASYPAAIW